MLVKIVLILNLAVFSVQGNKAKSEVLKCVIEKIHEASMKWYREELMNDAQGLFGDELESMKGETAQLMSAVMEEIMQPDFLQNVGVHSIYRLKDVMSNKIAKRDLSESFQTRIEQIMARVTEKILWPVFPCFATPEVMESMMPMIMQMKK